MKNTKRKQQLENYKFVKQSNPSFGSLRPTVIFNAKDKASRRANVKKELNRLLLDI